MIENTLENKAKFFAQYWGIEETGSDNYSHIMPDTWNEFPSFIGDQYLILTPLSQISDEDAIEVYKIILGESNSSTKEDMIFYGKSFCKEYDTNNENLEFSQTYWEIRNTIDFLRSRGYALPWMGISVEKLVEWGWVKLKSND